MQKCFNTRREERKCFSEKVQAHQCTHPNSAVIQEQFKELKCC